jgi:hypothetical protein
MMIASSTFNPLPEKSSSDLDLMSWIGRGNVLTIAVDMALLSAGDISRRYWKGIFGGHLRALREEGSHNLGFIRIQFTTEVGLSHCNGHSDHLLVAKGET